MVRLDLSCTHLAIWAILFAMLLRVGKRVRLQVVWSSCWNSRLSVRENMGIITGRMSSSFFLFTWFLTSSPSLMAFTRFTACSSTSDILSECWLLCWSFCLPFLYWASLPQSRLQQSFNTFYSFNRALVLLGFDMSIFNLSFQFAPNIQMTFLVELQWINGLIGIWPMGLM